MGRSLWPPCFQGFNTKVTEILRALRVEALVPTEYTEPLFGDDMFSIYYLLSPLLSTLEWLDHHQDQNPEENQRDCAVQDHALLALEPDAPRLESSRARGHDQVQPDQDRHQQELGVQPGLMEIVALESHNDDPGHHRNRRAGMSDTFQQLRLQAREHALRVARPLERMRGQHLQRGQQASYPEYKAQNVKYKSPRHRTVHLLALSRQQSAVSVKQTNYAYTSNTKARRTPHSCLLTRPAIFGTIGRHSVSARGVGSCPNTSFPSEKWSNKTLSP